MSHVWQRLFAMNADYNIVNPFFCAAFVDKAWNERSCMAGGYTVLTTQTQSVCRESFRLCAWPNEKWCMSCSTKLCSFRFFFFLVRCCLLLLNIPVNYTLQPVSWLALAVFRQSTLRRWDNRNGCVRHKSIHCSSWHKRCYVELFRI